MLFYESGPKTKHAFVKLLGIVPMDNDATFYGNVGIGFEIVDHA